MIDEQQQDLAIEYVFGHLEGEAALEFEAWLHSDEEMRTLVDELRESSAALALSAPQHLPPPHLRARALAIAHGEKPAPAAPIALAETAAPRRFGWVPWAIAAGLAIGAIVLQTDRERWRNDASNAKAEVARTLAANNEARAQIANLNGRLQLAEVQAKTHVDQIAELSKEVVKLRGRDALAEMKVATLTAQVASFAKAGVTIVWDAKEQRGIVKIANLPKAVAGKDYQLWVIDPQYPAPVSGGVLTVPESSETPVTFKPDQVIEHAEKFAISIEQSGGVPTAAGPIILAGE